MGVNPLVSGNCFIFTKKSSMRTHYFALCKILEAYISESRYMIWIKIYARYQNPVTDLIWSVLRKELPKAVDCFRKTLNLRCFSGFWIPLWIYSSNAENNLVLTQKFIDGKLSLNFQELVFKLITPLKDL